MDMDLTKHGEKAEDTRDVILKPGSKYTLYLLCCLMFVLALLVLYGEVCESHQANILFFSFYVYL